LTVAAMRLMIVYFWLDLYNIIWLITA